VEEQRTNLLLQSENLGTTWTLNNATSSLNTTIAPDGQTAADAVIPTNGAIGIARQDLSVSDSTIYTFSVFLKTNGLNSLNLQFYNKANTFHGSKNLELSTGVLSGTETIGVTSVVAYGNGWYRLIMTNLGSGTGATTSSVRIVTATTGNGTSGFYIWGAQLEAGAFATSYIPTTTAAATRAADVASITGSAFSSWYRQDEGTVFAEYRDTGITGANRFAYQVSDGTINNRIGFFVSGTTTINNRHVTAGTQVNPTTLSTILNGRNRHAIACAVGSCNAASGGTLATASSPSSMPSVTQLSIGALNAGEFLNASISRLTYFPARLPNTALQRMTQ
jgi:hypothetical protein